VLNLGGVVDLFQLPFIWNEVSIILLISYIGASAGGFFLIYKQVSLVKKGEFTISDGLQCIIYGLIFGLAVIVILAMIIIFIVNTPDLWQSGQIPPEVSPYALILPMLASMIYITFYPLFDFIFIAWTESESEGLTPFHEFFGRKIINRFDKPYSLIVAVLLYLGIIVLPPILIWQITALFGSQLRGVVVWSSWMLVYPMSILTFYGAKGFIAGISHEYYHIPEIKRSIFLGFEDGKRSMEDFAKNPKSYILFGLMLFVFGWTWISLIQTLAYYFSGTLAIETMSYWLLAIIVLILGIVGYFTRFWGRKIKFRGIDVYFAAYLIAAVGLNVLANFLIVNADKLAPIFNSWVFTEPISQQYINFVPAAIIEETVLLTFILYYVIYSKNEFVYNLKYALITKSGQTFDPIPIFNILKSSNPKLQNHAENTAKLMFERIPHKGEIDISKGVFKNAVLDGICDSHPTARRVSIEILKQLEKDIPDDIVPWIVEGLKSPNYDKKIPIIETLVEADEVLIEKIPINILISLIRDQEWRVRLNILYLLSRISQKSLKHLALADFEILLQDPEYEIQVETLKLLGMSTKSLPIDLVVEKLKHSNKKVRAAAAFSLKGTTVEKLDPTTIRSLISLMKDPNKEVRAEIFSTLAKIGNFKKHFVPIKPLLDGLTDPNKSVRNSAADALEIFYIEDPSTFNLDYLLSKILNSSNIEIHKSILKLLGNTWKLEPERIIEILLDYLTFEDENIRKTISKEIVDIGKENPELVFDKLIKIPDSAKFISKGIIATTAVQIVKENPKTLIPKLMSNLDSQDEQIKLTSINTLSDLVEEYLELIEIRPFIEILKTEKNDRIKKEAAKIISIIAIKIPDKVKPLISILLGLLIEQEKSVKITLAKSLIDIVRNSPEIIPVKPIIRLLEDKDSFVRESAAKILFHIGNKAPEETASALMNSLSDKEWIVRDAAVKSLGNLKDQMKDKKDIVIHLIDLLEDEQNWVRRSAMEVIVELAELSPEIVPFSKIAQNLKSEDERVRESAISLIKLYDMAVLNDLLPYITELLNDPSESVRDKTIISVSQFINKIGMKKILPSLLKLLSSDSPMNTQRSIAKIFLRTAKYKKEDVKKRIISLLKIRCEMSQDSVICSVLQELQ